MLLIRKIYYFFIVFLFIGCGTKELDYTYSSYRHTSHQGDTKEYQYVHPKYEQIKDSLAMHKMTLRSYTVAGIRYYPHVVPTGTKLKGIASWYGPNFHAKKTSNGEIYNMYAFTAAHKTLPMNTMVRVVNLENYKSVIVRINDRGPFVKDRIIDLSNVAARKIDMVKKGTARVEVEILSLSATLKKLKLPDKKIHTAKHQIKFKKIFVQIGAFSSLENATRIQDDFIMDNYSIVIKKVFVNSKPIYKVLVQGFKNEQDAREFINDAQLDGARIVGDI